jgi:hypothetical protein
LNQFFNICSLQYAFDKIYRLPKAFTPLPLSFGSAFHRVMEWAAFHAHAGPDAHGCGASDLFQTLWGRQQEEDKDIRYDGARTATPAPLRAAACAPASWAPQTPRKWC